MLRIDTDHQVLIALSSEKVDISPTACSWMVSSKVGLPIRKCLQKTLIIVATKRNKQPRSKVKDTNLMFDMVVHAWMNERSEEHIPERWTPAEADSNTR